MINPQMKFDGVHEISEIMFEEEPAGPNQTDSDKHIKSRLGRRMHTQMSRPNDPKKPNLPNFGALLARSETDYLSKSQLDSLGVDETLPKKLLSNQFSNMSGENAKSTIKRADALKRSESEHCFPKNRFSVQDVPSSKRNTLYNRNKMQNKRELLNKKWI